MSSSSSSIVKYSSSKPLNPLALSYEPQSILLIAEPHYRQDKIFMPHQFPLESYHLYEVPSLLPQVPESQSKILFPVVFSEFYPRSNFEYCFPWCWDEKKGFLNVYNPEKQPHPWTKGSNSSNSISYDGICYGSGTIVGKKKRGKWGMVPPLLESSRDCPMHNQGGWITKEDAENIEPSSDVHDGGATLLSLLSAEEQAKFDGKLSVMIKNVPNHFKRIDLQRILDYHCRTENRKAKRGSNFCKSAYDFLYLPMDFGFHLNLGFAFVSFTSPVAAFRFYRAYNKQEWSCGDRKKICEIGVAKFQGKDALKEQFQKSSFPCHTNNYLPVVFSPPRDGFNRPKPTLVGRRTHVNATSKDQRVMIMTQRKNQKKLNTF